MEDYIGEEIPFVKSAAMYNHGFSFEDKKVTKLSLLKKGLDSLPDCIGDFSNLQKLFLRDNKLKTLPDTIGNLTNLVELQTFNNPLKELPESLTKLRNLEKLGINRKDTRNPIVLSDSLEDWVDYLKSKNCKVNI